MTLHTAANRFGDQVLNLFATDPHIRQPLTCQQQLGRQCLGFLAPLLREAATALAMGEHRLGDLNPLLGAHKLVGRQCDREAIEQVIADRAFLRVVGGNQQWAAGVAEAQSLPLHLVLTTAHSRQHQVDDAVIQQVELVDIEHATVGFRQEPRLEHSTAARQGSGNIHGTDEPIFGDAQRDLHEGCRQHAGGKLACRIPTVGHGLPGDLIPFVRALGVKIAACRALDVEHVNGRQQGVKAPSQN